MTARNSDSSQLGQLVASLLIATAGLLLDRPASAQTNSFLKQQSISAIPLDLAVSPDGSLAVVRANDGAQPGSTSKLTVWQTSTGNGITIGGVLPANLGRGNLPRVLGINYVSDGVAVTNTRAVSIGSADTAPPNGEDTTYVDVLRIDASASGNQTSLLSPFVFGGPGTPATEAGLAHDVAITPDGTLAVVHHRNWIHVLDLVNQDPPAVLQAFHIGGLPSGPCWPGPDSVDSVELTNTRAVVVTARPHATQPQLGWLDTWVYIVDLSTTPPVLALEHRVAPPDAAGGDMNPHDVALTPSETMAVVTSSRGTSLFDLQNMTNLTSIDDNLVFRRAMPTVVSPQTGCTLEYGVANLRDSVVVTDDRAVTIGHKLGQYTIPSGPCAGPVNVYYWRLNVLTINQVGPTYITIPLTKLSPGSELVWNGSNWNPIKSADPVVDLALSPDRNRAAVRSLHYNVMLLDLAAPATPGAYVYEDSNGAFGNAAASDSVVIGTRYVYPLPYPQTGTGFRQYVAFVGDQSGPSPTARVDFYDLDAAPPVRTSFTISEAGFSTAAADLALVPVGRQIVARFTAAPDETNPAAGGRDWYRFDLDPLQMIGTGIGGSGACVGVDSLEVGRQVSVSISQDTNNPPGPSGFVHFVRIQ